MPLAELETCIASLESLCTRMAQGGPARKVEYLYFSALRSFFQDLFQAPEKGTKIVLHSPFIPTELIYGVGMMPFYPSLSTVFLATLLKKQTDFLDSLRPILIPWEICTAQQMGLAGTLNGTIPTPAAVVAHDTACVNAYMNFLVAADKIGYPAFLLNLPVAPYPIKKRFWIEQSWELVRFLEGVAGRKMDWEKVAEIVDYEWKYTQLWKQTMELKKHIPSPVDSRFPFYLCHLDWMKAGHPSLMPVFQAVYEDTLARLAGKLPSLPERFRLMILFHWPAHLIKILQLLEKEYGAKVVSDWSSDNWADYEPWEPVQESNPERLLESIAIRVLNRPMCSAVTSRLDERIRRIVADAQSFQVHGAIYPASATCCTLDGTIDSIRQALVQKGIPCLVLDGDIGDPTYTDEKLFKDKLESFVERLEEKRTLA